MALKIIKKNGLIFISSKTVTEWEYNKIITIIVIRINSKKLFLTVNSSNFNIQFAYYKRIITYTVTKPG